MKAAEYRDLIENVKRIGEKQKINDTGGDDGSDDTGEDPVEYYE